MKRVNNLYKELVSSENIIKAYLNAKKGKSHYREVKMIEKNPSFYLEEIQDLLLKEEYEISNYRITKRISGGKEREIYKLPFYPDRIIHHCIIQVVQKLWTRLLIRDTFSTIPKRGIHDGVRRVKKALVDKEGTTYCLKLDINKYYKSIDHIILKNTIKRKIKDEAFLSLLFKIIDSTDGVPIGNYISQWLGNVHLAYLDHYCKEELKCKYYFRYCDDIVVLSDSKEKLHQDLLAITEYLHTLNLKVKPNYQIFPTNVRGIDFLGYRFFHNYILVRKRIVQEMKHKLHNPNSLPSYYGWLIHANSHRLLNKYFYNNAA